MVSSDGTSYRELRDKGVGAAGDLNHRGVSVEGLTKARNGRIRPASAQAEATIIKRAPALSEHTSISANTALKRRDRLLELYKREMRKDYDKYPEGYVPRSRPITSISRAKGVPNSFGVPVVDLDAIGPARGSTRGNRLQEKHLSAGTHRTVRPRGLTVEQTWEPQLHAEKNLWASGLGILRK